MSLPTVPLSASALLRMGQMLLRRARGPMQRAATGALSRLGQRWPELADLLSGYVSPPPAAPPSRPRAAATEARWQPSGQGAQRATAGAGQAISDALTQLDSMDYEQRLAAVRTLAGAGTDSASAALIRALSDRSVEVAAAAAEGLGAVRGGGAREALRAIVSSHDGYHHALVRAAAVRALAQHADPADDDALHAAIQDMDAEVSIAAIASLAERNGPRDAEPLLALLEHGARYYLPVTRLTAARALGRLSRVPLERAQALAANETDADVRTALQALAPKT